MKNEEAYEPLWQMRRGQILRNVSAVIGIFAGAVLMIFFGRWLLSTVSLGTEQGLMYIFALLFCTVLMISGFLVLHDKVAIICSVLVAVYLSVELFRALADFGLI